MCYSALVVQDFKKFKREYNARIDLFEFVRLYVQRAADGRINIPKAMDANFLHPESAEEHQILRLIEDYRTRRTQELQIELFNQKKRLAEAERSLASKVTKAATESHRIATNKVKWHLGKLADLKRVELNDDDARIYPFHYAPVLVREGGGYVVKPMRYHCRPAGKPEHYDRKYAGLYNARRDNLEGFWKGQFGHTHAIVVMTGFYENVAKHDFEHRELRPGEKPENLVLNFKPNPLFEMRVACLWSRWQEPGKPDLLSFAAITDEPPPEVAATGHNRCVIPLKHGNLATWLDPEAADKQAHYAALDDRERPYYEHRLAA